MYFSSFKEIFLSIRRKEEKASQQVGSTLQLKSFFIEHLKLLLFVFLAGMDDCTHLKFFCVGNSLIGAKALAQKP